MSSEPRKTTADRLPEAIGPYTIRGRIGRGAMGIVYRAIDQRTKMSVALKALIGDFEGDSEIRVRFFREAHVAGKLRHRNIVTVLDSGEDRHLYIVMELLSGSTLSEQVKDSSFTDLEDRLDLMIQICQGLQVAHDAGVFHRDLKPANLFVCDDGRLKILDFGVARLVGSSLTVTDKIIGTPDFMSPEQVKAQDVDQRSDIFSAASVFYFLLTDRKPFAAGDIPAVLTKVVRNQPLPIREDEAPEPIAAVIRKAMSKDPDARQQTVGELAAELMAASSELEAATRQRALEVRRMADEVIQLSARRTELTAKLELPAAEDEWRRLTAEYPILQRGSRILGTYPLRSRIVREIETAIKTSLDALAPSVTALEAAYAEYSAGEDLNKALALEQAAERYSAARRSVPDSPVIARAIASSAAAIYEQREREARLESRLTLATEAAERTDWTALLAIVKEIKDIDPGNTTAQRLHVQATKNLAVEQDRAARDRSGRKTSASATDITALQQPIASPAEGGPNTNPAAGASARADLTQRSLQALRLREDAEREFAEGDLVAAERMAAQLVRLNSENAETRHLLERVRTEIILKGSKDETWRRVTEMMQRAHELLDDKNYAKALAMLDKALELDANHASAAAMRARVAAEQSTQETGRATEAARQQRARAAAPALEEAQRAFKKGDLEAARWSAESALALSPESAEARALLAQIIAVTPPPASDETVDDPGSDTAQISAGRAFPARISDLRDRAAGWFRRRGVSEAKDR